MIKLPNAFLEHPLAHRALHDAQNGRTENSIAAIEAAIEAGYGIEIDVQLSRDDQAMVFHDYDLNRLTGQTGHVRKMDKVDLVQIDLSAGGGKIPTLTETLDLVAGRVPLLIEIKDQDGVMGPNVGPLEAAVAACIQDYAGPLAVMSFNPYASEAFANLAPNVAVGLVTDRFEAKDWPYVPEERRKALAQTPDFDRIGCSFISHNVSQLGDAPVQDLKKRGLPILCWTVRSAEQEALARQTAGNITFEGYLA